MQNLIAGGIIQIIGISVLSGALMGFEQKKYDKKTSKRGAFYGIIILIIGACVLYFKPI